jgi:uncharacterized damage-inducible protein DinB
MNSLKELQSRYTGYNLWANRRIAGVMNELTEDIFITEQKSSFRTIKETILHIYDAETIWYNRLNGISLSEWPAKGFKGTGQHALSLLLDASSLLDEYTAQLQPERLITACHYRNLEGKELELPVYDIIQHCVNHSTFHRGQLITMLRFCGIEKLSSTDYFMYIKTDGK